MNTKVLATAALLLGVGSVSPVAQADGRSWRLTQLFQPSAAQLQSEAHGRVIIYHGLRDTEVNQAMDQQFDRIESMMFTGTIVTDRAGEPLLDTDTGEPVVESDGC